MVLSLVFLFVFFTILGFIHELRDDAGIGRLWGFMSRCSFSMPNAKICSYQDDNRIWSLLPSNVKFVFLRLKTALVVCENSVLSRVKAIL